MDNELLNRLLKIAIIGLIVAGLIFISLYLFSEIKNATFLLFAAMCFVLAILFNIIRSFNKK